MDYSGGHIGGLYSFTHFYTLLHTFTHYISFTLHFTFLFTHYIKLKSLFTTTFTLLHYEPITFFHPFTLSWGGFLGLRVSYNIGSNQIYKKNETNNEKEEKEAFDKLSKFLCLQMKQHIQNDLINKGKRDILPELEKIFPKFHIHGLTAHEILYPNDPSNSDHCRGDRKIFICTHC